MWINPPSVAATTTTTNILVTGQTLGTLRNNYTGAVGFGFIAVNNGHCVSLGRWVVSGNSQSHYIALCSSSCAVLASVQITTSGAAAGYKFASLATPVALTAGTTYYIMSQETASGDQWYDEDTTLTLSSEGTMQGPVYASGPLPGTLTGCSPAFVYQTAFGPVNMQYTVP